MKQSTRLLIAIVLYTIIGVGLIAVCINGWLKTKQITEDKETVTEYLLGEAKRQGYIGAEVTYKQDPPEIYLLKPNGKKVTSDVAEVYKIDSKTKTVTILSDSDDLGEWRIGLSDSKSTSYKFIETPSPTLYITDTMVYDNKKQIYVSFVPSCMERDVLEEQKEDEKPLPMYRNEPIDQLRNKCQYTITVMGNDLAIPVSDGIASVGQTVVSSVNLPGDILKYNGCKIHIAVCMLDNKENRSVKDIMIEVDKPTKELKDKTDTSATDAPSVAEDSSDDT